jgi:hypothetical protein
MFGTGVPTAENPQAKKMYLLTHGPDARPEDASIWSQYQHYLSNTSILVPLPPALYQPLPKFLKKTILLDFPIYQFDEQKDGPAVIEEERMKSGR